MANIDFNKLFETLIDGAKTLAISAFRNQKKEAETDVLNLMERIKVNLKNWTTQLSDQKMSKEDFEFLVLGQKDLLEMNALKQAGLALIRIDEFKENLLNFIVKTISDLI